MLSWLLGERMPRRVRERLAEAEVVLASELTLIECDRVLIRATVTGRLSEAAAAERRGRLGQTAEHWAVLGLTREITERARRPFPCEPIRTLDAIHLASALFARTLVPDTHLLTLDARIRTCGGELGFKIVPT